MGIRTRNLHNTVLRLRATGVQVTATASKDIAIVPFDGFISNIVAVAETATGASFSILDVNYMGTTIFSAATKITVSTASGTASYSALSSTPFSVTAGSYITLDADVVSTTLSNVAVDITISRTPVYSAGNLTGQDSVL